MRAERVDSPDAIGAEWSELAARVGNIFGTPEWVATWWLHFGRGRESAIVALRDEHGALRAVVPLYVWARTPVRVLRFIGHGPADQLGPVAPAELQAEALQAALAVLDWDVIVGDQLPAELGAATGGRVLLDEGSPLLRFPEGGWDGFLAGRSANLRSQLGRAERRLARKHGVAFRLGGEPERLADDLSLLFRLHRARWAGASTAFGTEVESFQRAFAAVALERGWLRLWFLELDEKPVAAWYGLRFGAAEAYYQSGRDPAYDDSSVGIMLLVHSIREASRAGVQEYRLLRGAEPYKYRFATDDPALQSVAFGHGRLGRAAVAAAASLLKLRMRA